MRRPKNFHKMETGAFELEGTHSIHILTPTGGVVATIDEDGTVWSVSVGLEHRLTVSDTTIDISTEGPVWRVDHAVQQPRTQEEIKYTTYDRPAPLSPEMQAIQRMAKANEIEREKLRKRLETYERRNEVVEPLATETDPPKGGKKSKRSKDPVEEPPGTDDSAIDGASERDEVPDTEETSDNGDT